ncbi:helix-turn-helix domain-containing protein [Streptomyces sp. NPDC048737]|uniref:TetR/AcrR family transcriptional regulator n=1 Tax=unclassified Streptomyces TaxID=2593676 RepID=UPI003443C8A8
MSARLLDAAHEQFCRMGIKRSTMTDVTRQAGISRTTVYRRLAAEDQLAEQVVRREFRRSFDRFIEDIRDAETVGGQPIRRRGGEHAGRDEGPGVRVVPDHPQPCAGP